MGKTRWPLLALILVGGCRSSWLKTYIPPELSELPEDELVSIYTDDRAKITHIDGQELKSPPRLYLFLKPGRHSFRYRRGSASGPRTPTEGTMGYTVIKYSSSKNNRWTLVLDIKAGRYLWRDIIGKRKYGFWDFMVDILKAGQEREFVGPAVHGGQRKGTRREV